MPHESSWKLLYKLKFWYSYQLKVMDQREWLFESYERVRKCGYGSYDLRVTIWKSEAQSQRHIRQTDRPAGRPEDPNTRTPTAGGVWGYVGYYFTDDDSPCSCSPLLCDVTRNCRLLRRWWVAITGVSDLFGSKRSSWTFSSPKGGFIP